MTAVSGEMYAYGAKQLRLYKLNSTGGIGGSTDTTAYHGSQAVGLKSFETTFPAARQVNHYGDLRNLSIAYLPPTDGSTASAKLSRHDYATHEIIDLSKNVTVGESKMVFYGTDVVDSLQDLMVVVTQLAKDASTKVKRYRNIIIPVTQIFVRPAGASDDAAEFIYDMVANPVTKLPWGVSLVLGTHGCAEMAAMEVMTETPLVFAQWIADGTATKFSFGASYQAEAVGKIHVVTVDGVADATVTKATDGVTPTSKPTAGQLIVAMYELAE